MRSTLLIDELINEVLSGTGNAQEKLSRLYGKNLSYNNAVSYLAGIKLHIAKMNEFANPDGVNRDYKEINFNNKDATQTVHQDVYLDPEEAISPVKVMQKMGFDPFLWEVISCKVTNGRWDVTLKIETPKILKGGKFTKEQKPVTKTNKKYSVVLVVRPLANEMTFPQILDAFKDLPVEELPQYQYESIYSNKGLLFELPIMDFHLGKLAWLEETGNDYDLKIAEALWKKTVTDLISKAIRFDGIEEILFPIGQDFFHFDTPRVTTTAGTQLDTDTRWQKMFRKGVELLVWAIENLRKIAPVKVLWIPGNHDQLLSYAAIVGLFHRYSEIDDVQVNLLAAPRKYILFGKNLIGYAHGEKEGKRLDGLMQIEVPELWGKSLFREFHMGHLHTELTTTTNGIVFRRISAITAKDAWHGENGFIGGIRQAQGFIWDKEAGLQAILNSNVVEQVQ